MSRAAPEAHSVSALRAIAGEWRAAGARIGAILMQPGLHAGKLSLLPILKSRVDRIVVGVAPDSMSPDACDMLASAGADLVFALAPASGLPDVDAAGALGASLERAYAAGSLIARAASALDLLSLTDADVAIFGERDYQLMRLVTRLTQTRGLRAEIAGAPTVREADGMAAASINAQLNPEQRLIAGKMNLILRIAARRACNGAAPDLAEADAADSLRIAGFDTVDYVSVADAETLAPFGQRRIDRPARILAAAWIGGVRLIDNYPLAPTL